jgi:hypothetical protein
MRNSFLIMVLPVLLFLTGCELQNPEVGVSVDDIITLNLEDENTTSILADGRARITFVANLGALADANQEIVFNTEAGTFAEAAGSEQNTFTIKASGKEARATLISNTTVAEEVIVTASVGDFITSRVIEFSRALPDDMTLTASSLNFDANGSDLTTLTVELFRNEGSPSDNARIDIETTPLDTAEVEVLPFVFTDGTTASFEVKSENRVPGEVTVTVTAEGTDGDIERSLTLTIEDN